MLISFFEEFPSKKDLDKLKLVGWPTKLYIAAKSVEEFNIIESKIKNRNVKEIIYWPVLDQKEGYWISPFSKRKALKRIFNELKESKTPVMLDLELPTAQNPWLYLTQMVNFWANKRLITKFVENYKGDVYLAEYYPEGKVEEKILRLLGLDYKCKESEGKKAKIIKMVYNSKHKFNENFVANELKRGLEEFGNGFLIAYGTIALGIKGNEPILSALQLKKNLKIARNCGIKEVIIFRLGGLNKKFTKIIKKCQ